ncbi:MAG TPA: hypothetical protein VND19_25000 [Acetobacteraceae bacterium]|nr:hypothetical protein [Acetobacteraceae bacterium]
MQANGMMGFGMTWDMALVWLLLLILVILGVAALVKYVFRGRG